MWCFCQLGEDTSLFSYWYNDKIYFINYTKAFDRVKHFKMIECLSEALLTAVNEKGKPYGMEMNIIKTKSMVISRKKPVPNISISVEGKPIQQVDRMVYLGYKATEDGKCDKEIKRRIGIARTAFESMAKILTSGNISIELRSHIAKCYIWSTLLYGAETWTLTKVTSGKLEAFEMWLYRRMLRISWKEHKTNGEN